MAGYLYFACRTWRNEDGRFRYRFGEVYGDGALSVFRARLDPEEHVYWVDEDFRRARLAVANERAEMEYGTAPKRFRIRPSVSWSLDFRVYGPPDQYREYALQRLKDLPLQYRREVLHTLFARNEKAIGKHLPLPRDGVLPRLQKRIKKLPRRTRRGVWLVLAFGEA